MNRVQLVQVIVIIVAMMLGYQTIYYFAFFIGHAFSFLLGAKEETYSHPYIYGVSALLFAIGLFLILNNAAKLSMWVINKVQPDENIQLDFTDKNLLYAVFLFITISSLLKNIPSILFQIFELFKKEAGASSSKSYFDYYSKMNYPQIIETILAFILLIKAKAVVNYFHQKIDPHDPHHISDGAASQPENE